jgi:PAS domain-containing protein
LITPQQEAGKMKLFYQPIAMAESLLANSPVGILVYEGDTGNCVLANQAIADMLGESVAALRLQNFRALASWRRVGLEDRLPRLFYLQIRF